MAEEGRSRARRAAELPRVQQDPAHCGRCCNPGWPHRRWPWEHRDGVWLSPSAPRFGPSVAVPAQLGAPVPGQSCGRMGDSAEAKPPGRTGSCGNQAWHPLSPCPCHPRWHGITQSCSQSAWGRVHRKVWATGHLQVVMLPKLGDGCPCRRVGTALPSDSVKRSELLTWAPLQAPGLVICMIIQHEFAFVAEQGIARGRRF